MACAWLAAVAAVAAMAAMAACAGDSAMDPPQPPAMVMLRRIGPTTILPRSTVIVEGDNLTESAQHFLVLAGAVGKKTVERTVTLETKELRARFTVDEAAFSAFGEGTFSGTAQVVSRNEWAEVSGPMLSLSLRFARHLQPTLTAVGSGVVFLNSKVPMDGTNLLLGGAEGKSTATLLGCFLAKGTPGSCEADGQAVQATIAVAADDPEKRRRGIFLFAPSITGVGPGRFEGTVSLANQHPDGTVLRSDPLRATFSLQSTLVSGFVQNGVSLGQYLEVLGEGFIEGTSLRFEGDFTDELGQARPASFELVTEYQSGSHGRCVVDEDGGIGTQVDLREEQGVLSGTWTPITRYGTARVEGEPAKISLRLLPIKQLVWVRFTGGWEDALKKFGLQAADREIRARVLSLFARDYAGINVEARPDEPQDFKLYARVDITGRDPNNAVQFGLDATAGKDTDNERLHDVIGGVNAETQDDGFRGYGGVFAESILGVSTHPPAGVEQAWIQSELFDAIFDPVRPDRGQIVSSAEVAAAPELRDAAGCPADDRPGQIACAVRVLGNLIGTTATHEFGHSLGLAKPYVGSVVDCHNSGDEPNRIMDAGQARPFKERAELQGLGPAVFCQDNYNYLRKILPAEQAGSNTPRPPCS